MSDEKKSALELKDELRCSLEELDVEKDKLRQLQSRQEGDMERLEEGFQQIAELKREMAVAQAEASSIQDAGGDMILPFADKVDEFGIYHSEEELERPIVLGTWMAPAKLETLADTLQLKEGMEIPEDVLEVLPPKPKQYVLDGITHQLVPLSEATPSRMASQGIYQPLPYYGRTQARFNTSKRGYGDTKRDLEKTFDGFRYGLGSNVNEFEWDWGKQESMIRRSQDESQRGIGRTIKMLTTAFVVGEGVAFKYEDPAADPEKNAEVSQLMQQFWDDNDMDKVIDELSDQIVNRGEIFCKANKDTDNKRYWCDFIEPLEIQDFSYSSTYSRVMEWYQWRGWDSDFRRKALKPEGGEDEELGMEYDFYHWAYNKPLKVVRGRSDLYAILYWLRLYNEFLRDRHFLNRFRSSVAWHKTIDAGRNTVNRAATTVEKPWPRGTVITTSNKVTLEALKANIDAGDVKADADQFREIIAGTSGYPIHWLFQTSERGSKSQAETMGRVPRRILRSRQGDLEKILMSLFFGSIKFYGIPKEELTDEEEMQERSASGYFYDDSNYCVQKKYINVVFKELDVETAEDLMKRSNAVRNFRESDIGSEAELYHVGGFKDYKRSMMQKEEDEKRRAEDEAQSLYGDLAGGEGDTEGDTEAAEEKRGEDEAREKVEDDKEKGDRAPGDDEIKRARGSAKQP